MFRKKTAIAKAPPLQRVFRKKIRVRGKKALDLGVEMGHKAGRLALRKSFFAGAWSLFVHDRRKSGVRRGITAKQAGLKKRLTWTVG